MSKRLDDLKKHYEESRIFAAEVNEDAAELKEVLAAKQAQVMDSVKKDLRTFYEYGKDLKKGWLELRLEDCKLEFYRSSYGTAPSLIVAFEPQGYVKLKAFPDGYSRKVDVYDLKSDRWDWYGENCKAYVTENWGMIRDCIEEELAKALEREAQVIVHSAVEKRDALQESIGAVKENVDWGARKDAVLHNALSLLLEDVWETSDDRKEGLLLLMDELGVTADELEMMGVNLTEFHFEKPLADVLEEATERSEEYHGFNSYDEIQRLTALRKERPLTQDEEETLFYCKNTTAEQDYYDSLD